MRGNSPGRRSPTSTVWTTVQLDCRISPADRRPRDSPSALDESAFLQAPPLRNHGNSAWALFVLEWGNAARVIWDCAMRTLRSLLGANCRYRSFSRTSPAPAEYKTVHHWETPVPAYVSKLIIRYVTTGSVRGRSRSSGANAASSLLAGIRPIYPQSIKAPRDISVTTHDEFKATGGTRCFRRMYGDVRDVFGSVHELIRSEVPIAAGALGAASLLKTFLPCSECNSSFIQYQLRLSFCSSPLSRGRGGFTVLSGALLSP